jgi:AraC-like DNA-binding protein
MNEASAALPIQYVRLIADQLREMGGDVAGWLGQGGLSEVWLRDPAGAVDHATFRRLLLPLLAREPALGLLVGERLLASSHGILGYAALSSGTLRQALEVFERYAQLRIPWLAIQHEVGPREVRVMVRETYPLGDLRNTLLEAVVLSAKNVLDAISMGSCQIKQVAFPFEPPEHASLARDLFGCEVVYGRSWAGYSLPAAVLDVPLKMADPRAFEEAAAICQRELAKLSASESMASRVRRLLLEKQSGFPSLQVTARLCHLTPRTLHRRLLDEGTSFRELLEDTRHTLALEHLKSRRFSIQEIAFMLGYSDLANFRRAFKRWEQAPPSARRPPPQLTAMGSPRPRTRTR